MSLLEIATVYTDLVMLEREIPEQEFHAKDRVNQLRSKYHELLMEQMRKDGIDFIDRFDAANQAFELVRNKLIA